MLDTKHDTTVNTGTVKTIRHDMSHRVQPKRHHQKHEDQDSKELLPAQCKGAHASECCVLEGDLRIMGTRYPSISSTDLPRGSIAAPPQLSEHVKAAQDYAVKRELQSAECA